MPTLANASVRRRHLTTFGCATLIVRAGLCAATNLTIEKQL